MVAKEAIKFRIDGGNYMEVDNVEVEEDIEERVEEGGDTHSRPVYQERRINIETEHGNMVLVPAESITNREEE